MADKSVNNEGTELENANTDTGDQDFIDAFDVAAKGVGAAEAKVDPADHPPAADNKGADAKADKEDKSVGDNKDTGDGKPIDYEQKWKSLDGIIKSKEAKFNEEKAQLAAERDTLKTQIAELSKTKPTKDSKDAKADDDSDSDDLTAEQKAILAEYEKDFDLVTKYEGLKREKALKSLEKRILKSFEDKSKELEERFLAKVAPLADTLRTTEEKEHFNLIKSAHPDFETYRDDGSILNWIGTKPKYMQDALKKTYSEGTAEDVVDLISDYKRENNLLSDENNESSQPSNVISMKKAEKKKALTAVVGKHGAVNISHAPSSDYDSAFDEAVNKK
jgi:hypothetical protein